MINPRASILDASLFGVNANAGTHTLSLAEVLARLARGDPLIFTGLRPHQAHAWHAFVVQCAALALHRAGASSPWTDPEAWRTGLLALTGGESAPWTPVVDDLAQPALLQPPVPEGTLDGFKSYGNVPDQLDSLIVTSINHVIKAARMGQPRLEHWIYALINLQTMQGFSGRSLYGIARMNSGYGNRPALGLSRALDTATRFQRDIAVWLDERDALEDRLDFNDGAERIALLWLEPWDGEESLGLHRVDPYFIEVCRRIRLLEREGDVHALGKPTAASRLAGLAHRGNVGDPWVPISRGEEPSALTTSGRGFHYSLLWQLWFGTNWDPGASLKPRREDGAEPWLVAQALTRGGGKTNGWHERRIRVAPSVGMLLRSSEGRSALANRAEVQMRYADEARRRVLRTAVLILQQGAPDSLNLKDERADPWTTRFDALVDAEFFAHLWSSADDAPADAEAVWCQRLATLADGVLRQAMRSTPLPSARRYKILTQAESALRGAAVKHLHCLPGQPRASATSTTDHGAKDAQ